MKLKMRTKDEWQRLTYPARSISSAKKAGPGASCCRGRPSALAPVRGAAINQAAENGPERSGRVRDEEVSCGAAGPPGSGRAGAPAAGCLAGWLPPPPGKWPATSDSAGLAYALSLKSMKQWLRRSSASSRAGWPWARREDNRPGHGEREGLVLEGRATR
jgi:hypothetical protein